MRFLSFIIFSVILLNYSSAFSNVDSCKVKLVYFKNPYNENRYSHCTYQFPCSPDTYHFHTGPLQVTYKSVTETNSFYKDIINDGNNTGSLFQHIRELSKERVLYRPWIGSLATHRRNASEIKFQFAGNEWQASNTFLWDNGKRYQTSIEIYSGDTASIDVAGILWGDTQPPQKDFGVYVGITHYDKKKGQVMVDSSGYLEFTCEI